MMLAANITRKQNRVEQIIDLVLYLSLLCLLALVGFACFYIQWPEGDPFEHLYASYIVSQGQVPYRDFFEHHHPLLWFLFSPVMVIFDRNSEVYWWANYLTFLFFMVGVYYIYRTIIEFLGNRFVALAAVLFILLPDHCLYYVYFKPDNWMLSCFFIGLYFYLKYMRDKIGRDLCVSFICFIIAFLFLQKALFYFPIIGIVTLWGLYTKKIAVADFFKAIVLPVIFLAIFVGYFAYHDAIKEYFVLTFKFNQQMVELFGGKATSLPVRMFRIFVCAGLFVSLGLYKFQDNYFRLYCWIFWCILLQRLLYFSPYTYYWYDVYVVAVPLVAAGAYRLILAKKVLMYLIFAEMFFYIVSVGYDIYWRVDTKSEQQFSRTELVNRLTNRCDKFLSFGSSRVIFTPILGYYWFLRGHVDVFGDKMGIHRLDDYNEIIKTERPKIIYVKDTKERYPSEEKRKIIHKPDMELIEKLYYPTIFASDRTGLDSLYHRNSLDYKRGLWLLKKEYRQKNCHFDEKLKVWKYDD